MTGSLIKVADNSGPCFVRIIKVLGTSTFGRARIGSHFVGAVQSVHQRKKFKVKKGSIVRGVYIRLGYGIRRKEGQLLRFQKTSVIIATRNGLPKGTKIYGPIPKELREKGYIRLVSLATVAL